MASTPEQAMTDVIDFMTLLVSNKFSDQIGMIYYGDIGQYPLRAFQDTLGNPRAVIAFSPAKNTLVSKSRTTLSEIRDMSLDILVMVNISPYFGKTPDQAPGERRLNALTDAISVHLTKSENYRLGEPGYERVMHSEVGDVEYQWVQRGKDAAIRQARIEYNFRVSVKRIDT